MPSCESMAPQSPLDSAADEVRAALGPALQRFGPDYWREQDAAKTFPTEFFDTIGEAGYFGTFIPEAYGGSPLSYRVYLACVREISEACASTGIIWGNGFPRHQTVDRLWHRIAEGTTAAAFGRRRNRIAGDYRARCRLGCNRHENLVS